MPKIPRICFHLLGIVGIFGIVGNLSVPSTLPLTPVLLYPTAMRLSSPSGQFVLLLVFGVSMAGLWMAPVLLAGYPYEFTQAVKAAHLFTLGAGMPDVVRPLFTLVIRALLPFIDWRDATGWAAVSAVTLALAILPLWWSIRRLFGARVAWASVVLFCLMPMQWQEAVNTQYYPLSLLCLFAGFAAFLFFVPRHRFLAAAFLGAGFGLALACNHAFVTFLPWFLAVYLWERRAQWRRSILELISCGAVAFAAFALTLLPAAMQPGLTSAQRLEVFLPVGENLLQPSEVYGDDYAYQYLKKEFDERMAREAASPSFFERRESENFRMIYGIGSTGFFRALLSGAWLFINALAALFMQETMGGMFLWLFILPGMVVLYRNQRRVFYELIGLWLSMELILRFGFHYGRVHLMDIGWVPALFAGAGIAFIADAAQRSKRSLRTGAVTAVIVLLAAAQLIQENRKIFAQLYARSGIPRAQAAAEALRGIPADAVIAQPRDDQLLLFTDHSSILLQNDTIDVLAEEGKLADPFRRYGVTHIIDYDAARAALIRKAMPSVKEIPLSAKPPVELTPFKRYLLNVIR